MLLGKKLISILLFGSSVLTLVGNSNVYANEDGAVKALEAAQEGEKLVGRDDNNKTNPEALTSVENSDVRADENEIVEEGKNWLTQILELILKIMKILTRMMNQKVLALIVAQLNVLVQQLWALV